MTPPKQFATPRARDGGRLVLGRTASLASLKRIACAVAATFSVSAAHASLNSLDIEPLYTRDNCAQALTQIEKTLTQEFQYSRAVVLLQQGSHRLLELSFGRGIHSTTPFLLGSVNKTLDAVTAMRLHEKGNLKLDQPIEPFLPENFRKNLSADWGTIKIRNLLNHTSGIADYINQDDASSQSRANQLLRTPQNLEALLDLAGKTLWFHPLTQLAYSNTNYLLLAHLLEKLTGKTLEDNFKAELVQPLSLQNTGVARQMDPEIVGSTGISLPNLLGVGNAYSTADDLLKVLRGLDGDTPLLTTGSIFDFLYKSDPACHPGSDCHRYGMGFSLRSEIHPFHWNWVLHEGHLRGVSHVIAKIPDQKLNLVILSDESELSLEGNARGIFSLLIGAKCF